MEDWMTKACAAPALVMLFALGSCQAAEHSAEPAGAMIGPVTFRCDDGSAILATFDNAPEPAIVHLVRGGEQATLPQAMSASGARYVGDDITFWNKGRDAAVEWQGQKLACSTAG
jgi:membrane-bound inhibitor of C-type lysozyme